MRPGQTMLPLVGVAGALFGNAGGACGIHSFGAQDVDFVLRLERHGKVHYFRAHADVTIYARPKPCKLAP